MQLGDGIVGEREKEKWSKYQELAVEMAMKEQRGKKVVFSRCTGVVGTMGVIEKLREHLKHSQLLKTQEIDRLSAQLQREALCGTCTMQLEL